MKMTNEALVAAIQEGHTELQEVLITQNINLVRRLAHMYNIPGVSVEDRIQDGCMGMLEAIPTYQAGKGKFSTHAFRRVRAKILREGNEQANMIHVPSGVVELRMSVNKYMREQVAITGRRPNAEAVASYFQRDVEDIKYVISMDASMPSSLDQVIEGGEGDTMQVSDIIGGEALEAGIWRDERTQAIVDYLDELPEVEQKIVIARLGLKTGESKTVRELEGYILDENESKISYVTINDRYNKAIDYIKARINGEQIIFQRKTVRKPVQRVVQKDTSKRDVVLCVSQANKVAFLSVDIKFSQVTQAELAGLMKQDTEASKYANMDDALFIQYSQDNDMTDISNLSSAVQDAVDSVNNMGFELVLGQVA